MTSAEWFTGSKAGLEKIARRRGLSYVLFELVSNCWDTGAKEVKVTFEPVPGRPLVDVTVEDDDPDGFQDLTHAFTLFAESSRKADAEKRGRFNFGEKLVLAVCESAEVVSTVGGLRFDPVSGRQRLRTRTERGTIFRGRVKMSREELAEVLQASRKLLSPYGVVTSVDGHRLRTRPILQSFEASLSVEIADEEGFLVTRLRKTSVEILLADGEEGYLYELGIPVCPTGDKYDLNVKQKVPVNLERNSVSESYLRTLRVLTLNEMFKDLTKDDVAKPLVQEALMDKRVDPVAVREVLALQYGEKRAVYDPSDKEANHRLVADGYTMIGGNAFSKPAWENIRASGAALPSGQIRPTPKPYSDDPDAPMAEMLPESEWTEGMRAMAGYSIDVAFRLIKKVIRVKIDKGKIGAGWGACYGSACLVFNLSTLGYAFFEEGPSPRFNALLIHELAHESMDNHLDDGFYKALQKLGAGLTELALKEPEMFRKYGWKA